MTNERLDAAILSAIVGFSMLFVFSIYPVPETIPMIVGLLFAWGALYEGEISGSFAVATSLIYLFTGGAASFIGLFPTDLSTIEVGALFAFGVYGILGYLIGGLFAGAANVLYISWKVKGLGTVNAVSAVGIPSAVFINTFFKLVDFPIISDWMTTISFIFLLGAGLSFALFFDSAQNMLDFARPPSQQSSNEDVSQHRIKGTDNQRKTGFEEVKINQDLNELQSTNHREFITIVGDLCKSIYEDVTFLREDGSGNATLYCQTKAEDGLVIIKRKSTLSNSRNQITLEISKEIENIFDSLDQQPTEIVFVTDAVLRDDYFNALAEEGLIVVDGEELGEL